MPVNLDCPRCKQSLVVPTKKIGTYVNCPRCNGRFWVPESARESGKANGGYAAGGVSSAGAPAEDLNSSAIVPLGGPPLAVPPGSGAAMPAASAPSSDVGRGSNIPPPPPPARSSMALPPAVSPVSPTSSPPPAPPAPSGAPARNAPTLNPAGGVITFDWTPPATAPAAGLQPPLPPVAPPARKVARFVTAEAAASGLQLAEDGKLPELRLQEGQQTRTEKKHSGMNPLVLAGLLSLSVAMSIGLVLLDPNAEDGSAGQERQRAWRQIETDYFSNLDPNAPLQPYQVYLREARQAETRGDGKTETDRLRKVLGLLRTERGGLDEKQRRLEGTQWSFEKTLTGSPDRDATLEKHISTLLRHR